MKRHYGFHPFLGRKDAGVVQAYIRYYTRPGDTVLDVFGGSGTTAREALILRRKVIIADLNPVAELITKASVLPVDFSRLDAAQLRLSAEVSGSILAIDQLSPAQIESRLNKFDLNFLDVPIHRLIRRGKARGFERLIDLHDPRQLLGLLLLRQAIDQESDRRVHLLLKVAFSHTLKYATKMYTSERKQGFGYWAGNASPFQHGAYQAPQKYTYKNVWDIFAHVLEGVRGGKEEGQRLIGDFFKEGDTFIYVRGSATELSDELRRRSLPAEAIADYCITDPPYAERVQYGLLFSLWYPWLGLEPPPSSKDLTVESRGDTARRVGLNQEFIAKLGIALGEISRALKPGAWLTLFYQHPNLAYWQAIVEQARDHGLRYINLVPQPSVKSFSQLKHPFRTIAGDLMLNLRKLSEGQWASIYHRKDNRIVFPSLQKFAELELQRVIVEYLGAPTEVIGFHVIPALLDPNLVSDKVQEAINIVELIKAQELDPFGAEHVSNGEKDLWMLKVGTEIDPAIDFYDRLRYHLFDFLRRAGSATMLELQAEALKLISTGTQQVLGRQIELPPILGEFAEAREGRWHYSPEARNRAVQMRLILAQSSAEQLRPVFFRPEDRVLPLQAQALAALSERYHQPRNKELTPEYRRLQNLLVAVLMSIRNRFSASLLSVAPINELADAEVDLSALELEDLTLGIVHNGSAEEAFELETLLSKEVFGPVFLNSGVMFAGIVRSVEYAEWLSRKDLIIMLGSRG